MNGILDFIAAETNGTTYKLNRFCFDAEIKIPLLSYQDSQEFTISKDKRGETDDTLKTTKNLGGLFCSEPPLFAYFLDGSRRVYKVDDVEYGKRPFPIVGGQIGVACCVRKSADNFGKASLKIELSCPCRLSP